MEVAPEKQNIDAVFSGTNYHVDFYQREYKWTDEEVTRLLDDVFYKFRLRYKPEIDATVEKVTENYPWYYLNTYITNKTQGRTYVVDGQQRLTTLSLILIKLYHMCSEFGLDKRQNWLRTKIIGYSPKGEEEFWIGQDRRREVFQALFDGNQPDASLLEDNLTAQHITQNYETISKYLGKELQDRHRLDTFIIYFLRLLVLINLDVVQTDVPMVFEVINDRGIRLQPYEILKGKLLGEIPKSEVGEFADLWEKTLHHHEAKGLVDDFFRTYFRARFAATRDEGREFDGPYHRTIFMPRYNAELQLDKNPAGVKEFLRKDFRYYGGLHLRLVKLGEEYNSEFPHMYFNAGLNQMDTQIMLTMAACSREDGEGDKKILAISCALDRAYVMLQLNRVYDSNRFQELVFALNKRLRGRAFEEIEATIDAAVLEEINERKSAAYTSLLTYPQFRGVGYADYNTRFLRYFLARIELFLSEGLGKSLSETQLYNFVRGTGRSNAYHVEHVLARNEEAKGYFRDAAGVIDNDLFEQERNRFGGLVLLKGRDNASSGNEKYADKLRTYTGSAPYWAQTLVEDFYKSNTTMVDFQGSTGLAFAPIRVFDRKALEDRSRLLFEIVKRIWNIDGD